MSEEEANRPLVRAGAVMAAGTLLSRAMGFVRAIMLAAVLGNATRQADMFALANTIPTSLYILFAGGALNSVLVPQIVRATKHDQDRGEAYTNRIMTAFLVLVGVVTVALVLLAPLLLRIYTDAQWRGEEVSAQYQSMLTLAYLCLPQVFFYGAFFLAGQVLNARGHFGPMMFAPVVNNVISVLVLGLYLVLYGTEGSRSIAFTTSQELVLGVGATLGIVAQTAVLVPFLRRAGFVYRPRFDLRGTGLGRTFSLAKWSLGFVAVTQLALVAVNRLASSATAAEASGAGVNVYMNAYLIWILPHSVITVSLATAMVTSASRLAAEDDLAGVARESRQTIRLATTVVLPAAVAFAVLSQPIAQLAFGFGEGAADFSLVGWTLLAFALGLVPFTLHYVLLRTFYALEDTRTPFLLQALVAGLNAGLAVGLVALVDDARLVAPMLGLAYSLAYLIGVVVAWLRLQRRLPELVAAPVVRHLARVTVAVLPAAGLARLITWYQPRVVDSWLGSAAGLVVAGLVAVAAYLVMARLLRLREVSEILGTVLRRGGRGGAGEVTASGSDDARPQPPAGDDVTPRMPPVPTPGAAAEPETEPMTAVGHDGRPRRPGPEARAHDDAADGHRTPGEATPGGDEPGGPEADHENAGPGATSPDGTGPDSTGPDSTGGPVTDPSAGGRQRAGDVLGRRYRLEEVVAGRADTHTWRAFDQVLSRSVLVQVLPPEDPRSPDLLEAARASAAATDSRFLRVLDAVPSTDPQVGSYIVTEYTPGQTLEMMLSRGPLSALEAAWVVRETADALTGVHALGLFHRQLGPDAVTITPAGNVKITGFLLEAAITGRRPESEESEGEEHPAVGDGGAGGADVDREDPDHEDEALLRGLSARDPERDDVRDLGRLLFASLVSRWPDASRFGLERAPEDGARVLTPRQVRHGVSPALDRVCDRILSPTPRHQQTSLRSAAEVAHALSAVLGTAEASHDLERRVAQPVPVVGAPPTSAATTSPLVVEASLPRSPGTPRSAPEQAPGGPRVVGGDRGRRPWLTVLLVVLLLALLVGLVGVFVRGQARFTGDVPQTSASAAPAEPGEVVEVSRVVVFDPEGDPPGDENNDLAPLAVDGDPETAWATVYYLGDPGFGGLKEGLGIVLDLGEATSVSGVRLQLPVEPTALELRVPTQSDLVDPPLSSAESWAPVAVEAAASGSVEVVVAEPVTTRYLLLYLTSLPPDGDRFRGQVFEVEVVG